ncbi:MAG: CHAT domain-containing protein [Bacteroidota bacterium]
MRVLSLLFLLMPGVLARPDCEAVFQRAQASFDRLDTRTADSLAVAATRRAFQEARACYAATPTLDSTAANHLARAYGRDAQILLETGQIDEVAALIDTFFDGPYLRADSAGVRYMLEFRGFILDQQGRVEESLRARLRLLDYAASATPAVRTRIWMGLAGAYDRLGQWDEALAIYETVQRTLGAEPELELQLRVSLARAYTREAELRIRQSRRPDAAARSLVAARTATDLLRGLPSPRAEHFLVFARITLADAYLAQGQADSALVVVQAAADLAARLQRPSRSAEITSWEAVGTTHLALGQAEAARAAFEEALAVGDRYGVQIRRPDLFGSLAQASMRLGDFARADSLVGQALRLVEAERAGLSAEVEASRAGTWYDTYLTRVSLLLARQRPTDAFLALDEARARVLRDLRHRRVLLGDLAPETRRRADSLTATLEARHRRFAEPDLDPVERLRLRGEIEALEADRAAVLGDGGASVTADLGRMQQTLAARGQVLLTYHPAAPQHAFVLRPDTLVAVPLADDLDAARIEALMAAVSPLWVEGSGPVDPLNLAFDPAPLKTLYDLLIAPVAPYLPEGAGLVVVPEGPLAQLPFGLLLEEAVAPTDPMGTAPFLLRRHAISTELAAGLLAEDEAPSGAASDLVAFGRSAFGGVETDSPLRSVYEEGAPPDLPNVARELADLGRRFPSAFVALDEEATESRFYERLEDARLLHIASHAFVEDANPLGSYIQLSPDPDSTEDGRLYLYELMQQPLAADLVVLSGCRTARGRDLLGEGVLGLQYAVRAAGAASTLGTLWRVDDAATVELMDGFYAHLARGERKDVALQQAQLDYLETHGGLRSSPFFWAAPILYGDPSPVPIPSGFGVWWWIVGAGLVASALLLPRALRRRRPGTPPPA